MTKKFFILGFAVMTLASLSSCLRNEEEEIVRYNDAGITAFSIKSMNIYTTARKDDGKEEKVKQVTDGGKYAFYVDQIKKEIYNVDSLPMGVDVEHVIVNIGLKRGSVLALQSLESDSVKYFDPADSVDFSQPRHFVVFNSATTAKTTYKVKLNVHQQKPNAFNWFKLADNNSPLAALSSVKALENNGKIYVFGQKGVASKVYSSSVSDGRQWTEIMPSRRLSQSAFENMVVKSGKFVTLNEGKLLSSEDAKTWNTVGEVALKRLLGATNNRLYAYSGDNKIMVSRDGLKWEVSQMDADASLLPQKNISFTSMSLPSSKQSYQLCLLGTGEKGNVIWGKTEENGGQSIELPWSIYEVSGNEMYRLPDMDQMQVIAYGGNLIAVGLIEGKIEHLFYSHDRGISWKVDKNILLPQGVDNRSKAIAMAKDAEDYLWLICGQTGQVWKGRFNKLR